MKKDIAKKTVVTIVKCELLALTSAAIMAAHYCYELIGWYEDWLRLLWEGSPATAASELDLYQSFNFFAEEFAMAGSTFGIIAILAAIVGLCISYKKYISPMKTTGN